MKAVKITLLVFLLLALGYGAYFIYLTYGTKSEEEVTRDNLLKALNTPSESITAEDANNVLEAIKGSKTAPNTEEDAQKILEAIKQ